MKVNAKTEYALRTLIDLAARRREQTTLEEVAERQKIPATILPGIVQTLAKAGLVETSRGYRGGIRLGQPARDINVRMALEAIEGPLQLYRCESAKASCPLGLGSKCPLRTLWKKTQSQMLQVWEQFSLADLANGHKSKK